MRVLIVDDEPAARRRLALMLEELDEEVVGQAANGMEALQMAAERRPELLLLDVEMPEVDGFDVLRHIGEPRPLVVFQTAYDEYALRAFEHAALDYLVKPVTRAGLERAFPFPEDWAAHAPDDLVVCRCENITAGELRRAIADSGADEMNRLKALTRVGMGRCQGRMCGVAAAEILAHATGQPVAQVGRLRGQAPIKPIPIHLVHATDEGVAA